MDSKVFYDAVKASIFGGFLRQTQVDALNAILAESARRRLPLESVAYVMATAYWEAGADLVPREENLRYTTAARIRAVWPARFPTIESAAPFVRAPESLAMKVYGRREDLGNLSREDGWTFRGRGLVQITGRDNYARAEARTGIPLVSEPQRMLDLGVSVRVLVAGMQEGWFTGVTLEEARAVPGYEDDRRIVNGTNEARRIADIAEAFETALKQAGYGASLGPADELAAWISAAPADVAQIGAWLVACPGRDL